MIPEPALIIQDANSNDSTKDLHYPIISYHHSRLDFQNASPSDTSIFAEIRLRNFLWR